MRDMNRRTFVRAAIAAVPLPAIGQGRPEAGAVHVLAGQDRFGEHKELGLSTIDFKVSAEDSGGASLVIENTNRGKGGPARHLHTAQEEMFYVLEGEYVIEVGGERFDLRPGDSILGPRQVPHVWAYVGTAVGRLLVTFTPAGGMEDFFREVSKANSMPPQDPSLWRAHGMELLGPPLSV